METDLEKGSKATSATEEITAAPTTSDLGGLRAHIQQGSMATPTRGESVNSQPLEDAVRDQFNILKGMTRLEPLFFEPKTIVDGLDEQVIGPMYLKNMLYMQSKIFKHSLVYRVADHHTQSLDSESLELKNRFTALCTPERLDELGRDLANYSAAAQDYHNWQESNRNGRLPIMTGFLGEALELAIIESELHHKQHSIEVLDEKHQKIIRTFEPTEVVGYDRFIAATHKNEKRSQFHSRLKIALFGGFAVVIPLLILTHIPNRQPIHHVATILTISVCVVGVAVILACWMKDAVNKDIVAATAAYAAVLMVFIGVNPN